MNPTMKAFMVGFAVDVVPLGGNARQREGDWRRSVRRLRGGDDLKVALTFPKMALTKMKLAVPLPQTALTMWAGGDGLPSLLEWAVFPYGGAGLPQRGCGSSPTRGLTFPNGASGHA